jgi:hypothetical protein
MMADCPLCRLPLKQVGRHVQARDDAGHFFVFALCMSCRLRLDRLPTRLQQRQHDIAIRRLSARPDRHDYVSFANETEAAIFCRLSADIPSFPSSEK